MKHPLLTQLAALCAGILFGLGMVISQMTVPSKVLGFLDIFGQWQGELVAVMGAGIAAFAAGYAWLIKPRQHSVLGQPFGLPQQQQIDASLISGAVLFGLGWGIAGICPGPAIASISMASAELLWFVLPMLLGMALPRWLNSHSARSPSAQ